MVLFIISIIIFNLIVMKMKKHLSKNRIVHIWAFSMISEITFDIFIDEKMNGYWYFWKGIDWTNILVYALIIPPVNVIFLNWFPFNKSWSKKLRTIISFIAIIIAYEVLALLPEPWGYFHYGWWHLYYSLILDPILVTILLLYYKWICKIEKSIQ